MHAVRNRELEPTSILIESPEGAVEGVDSESRNFPPEISPRTFSPDIYPYEVAVSC